MKKLILLLSLSISIIQAEHPIILWDLHDVLLQPKDRVITLFRYPYLKQFFQQISWPFIKDLAALITHFSSSSSEEYLALARKHDNPHFAEIIIRYANAQEPIPGMPELVNELAALGIEQHIGSNIGKTSFHRLLDAKKHPDLVPIFEHMNIGKSHVVSLKNGVVVNKPNPAFFKDYLQKNNLDPHKTPIIFIDDQWKNILVAKELGFDAIHFKNPRQLRMELSKRGILVKSPKTSYSTQRDSHRLHWYPTFYKPSKLF